MGYKIGSFNVRNLGLSALGNERDLRLIAEIIKREQFDVVALQEVLSEGKAFTNVNSKWTKKSIMMELGKDWDFQWADVEAENDRRHEGYAFLWNKKRLRLATTKLVDGEIRTFNPRVCRMNKEEMIRQPYYARFTPQGKLGGSNFEIRLICVHTYYGKDTKEDRERRQHEIDVLLKDIYPQVSDRVYKDQYPAYTILLGDYNVELRRNWHSDLMRNKEPAYLVADEKDVVVSKKWNNRRIKTVQDQLTTLKTNVPENEQDQLTALKSNISPNGQEQYATRGYANNYDHFSYEESRFEDVHMKVRRVDAVRKYCGDSFEKYYKTVSDHIPIMMEIDLK